MRFRICTLFALGLFSVATGVGGARTQAPTATQVVNTLKSSGFPIGKYKAYNELNDINHLLGRPGQYTGKVNFRDTRVKAGTTTFDVSEGGAVEIFKNRADALRRFKYVKGFGETSLFSEYDYLEGRVLLRLSHFLTPSQAKKYEAALRRNF